MKMRLMTKIGLLILFGIVLIAIRPTTFASACDGDEGGSSSNPNCILQAYTIRWNGTTNATGYDLTYTIFNTYNGRTSPTIYLFTALPYNGTPYTTTYSFQAYESHQFSAKIYGPEVSAPNETEVTIAIGEFRSGVFLYQDYPITLQDVLDNNSPSVTSTNVCVNITIYNNNTININNTNYIPVTIYNNNTININNTNYVPITVYDNNTIKINETNYIPVTVYNNNTININNTNYVPVTVLNNNSIYINNTNYVPVTLLNNNSININNTNYVPVTVLDNNTINVNNTNYVPITVLNNETIVVNNTNYVPVTVLNNETIVVNNTVYTPVIVNNNNSITINNTVYTPITVNNNDSIIVNNTNYIPVSIYNNNTIYFNGTNYIPISIVNNNNNTIIDNQSINIINNNTITFGMEFRTIALCFGMGIVATLFILAQYQTQRLTLEKRIRKKEPIERLTLIEQKEDIEEIQRRKINQGNFISFTASIIIYYLMSENYNPVDHFQFIYGWEFSALLMAIIIYFGIQTIFSTNLRIFMQRLMLFMLSGWIYTYIYNPSMILLWIPFATCTIICVILNLIRMRTQFMSWWQKIHKNYAKSYQRSQENDELFFRLPDEKTVG